MSVIELGEEDLSSKARQYLNKEEFDDSIISNRPLYLTDQINLKSSASWWGSRAYYSFEYGDLIFTCATQLRSNDWYFMYQYYNKTTKSLTYVEEFIADMDANAPCKLDGNEFHVNYRSGAPTNYHRSLDLDTLVLESQQAGYDTWWVWPWNSVSYLWMTRSAVTSIASEAVLNYLIVT